MIPLQSDEDENAVRLMTVHGAKGLEFPHVFILRAISPSFPCPTKRRWLHFLESYATRIRSPRSDDKTLHEPGRAPPVLRCYDPRTRLTAHLRKRRNRQDRQDPSGIHARTDKNKTVAPWFRAIPAGGAQATLDMAAAASPLYPDESQTTRWFELPVLEGLHNRLSASAVETYRALRIAVQTRARLAHFAREARRRHAVWRGNSSRAQDVFRFDSPRTSEERPGDHRTLPRRSGEAKIQESYQHELYEKQGILQLQDFLSTARSIPASQVLHTEESFEIKIGETTVVGRIDRIDQLSGWNGRYRRLQNRQSERPGRR